jgi:hypothetical protein
MAITEEERPVASPLRSLIMPDNDTYAREQVFVLHRAHRLFDMALGLEFDLEMSDDGESGVFRLAHSRRTPEQEEACHQFLKMDHAALHPGIGVVAEHGGDLLSIITRQPIHRGSFTSVKDLIAAIENFIDGWNDRCQPFTWTKTADELLPHCKPGKRTSFTRH